MQDIAREHADEQHEPRPELLSRPTDLYVYVHTFCRRSEAVQVSPCTELARLIVLDYKSTYRHDQSIASHQHVACKLAAVATTFKL
jgi:hypothetical protein